LAWEGVKARTKKVNREWGASPEGDIHRFKKGCGGYGVVTEKGKRRKGDDDLWCKGGVAKVQKRRNRMKGEKDPCNHAIGG